MGIRRYCRSLSLSSRPIPQVVASYPVFEDKRSSSVPAISSTLCSPGWIRTSDLRVNSSLLCQLSYRGIHRSVNGQ